MIKTRVTVKKYPHFCYQDFYFTKDPIRLVTRMKNRSVLLEADEYYLTYVFEVFYYFLKCVPSNLTAF